MPGGKRVAAADSLPAGHGKKKKQTSSKRNRHDDDDDDQDDDFVRDEDELEVRTKYTLLPRRLVRTHHICRRYRPRPQMNDDEEEE